VIFSTYRRALFAWALCLLTWSIDGSLTRPAYAEEGTVRFDTIGPDRPTPYKKQFHVVITNESFTSLPLIDKVNSSELLVDHHPYKRVEGPFLGPVGLPAKGSWEGCIAVTDYLPQGLPPGSHRLQWQLGNILSDEIRVKWPKTVPIASSPKERLRQVEILRESLEPGLLKSCVENWLTDKDGGLASSEAVRYYVDPGVKVLVPYDRSTPEPRIKGPIQIYLESPVAD
jgi:hypothetical protein